MSDVAETKPDPATNAPEAQKPEESTPAANTEESKPAEDKSVTEAAVDTVKDAAGKTSDSVFSMFGGGPKKEKKEEAEDAKDEPSGSSKAQKGEGEEEVSCFLHWCLSCCAAFCWIS
jgi:Ran-binding protein 1